MRNNKLIRVQMFCLVAVGGLNLVALGAGAPPERDTDGDGVVDRLDRCPVEFGPAVNAGCPDTDTDGDGIVDRLDNCPTHAGLQKNGGCPEPQDADHDGIPDVDDRCPTVPGDREHFGCPGTDSARSAVPAQPGDDEPVNLDTVLGVLEGVTFAEGSARINPNSFSVLRRAATVLARYPEVRMTVAGFTDDIGESKVNRALSQRRARALREWFIKQGIDSHRIVMIGSGARHPIASNRDEDGRGRNRRVELRIVAASASR